MDDKRFDNLTRLVGIGASRRAILKGLLGIGGTAVAGGAILSDSDARTIGTRPTIPPPPTRTPTPVPTTTPAPTPTPDPCPAPNFKCGLDCCADELQCCDGECCPDGTACLTKAFYGESLAVEEETCCDLDQTCDGQCCAGTCFWPLIGQVGVATVLDIFDRTCCPGGDGITFCPGEGQFSTFGSCCSGGTPHCCHDSLGRPVCISEAQCCTTDECVETGFDRDCIVCDIDTNTCEPANENTTCAEFECGVCQSGHCAPDESLCFTCEQCTDELRCVPDCRPSTCGCPPCQTCNQETGICEPLCRADQHCCAGVCFDEACCTVEGCVAAGFDRDCVTCDIDTNTCIQANENSTCAEFECGICQSGSCAPDESLCFACEQCSEDSLRCVPDCRPSTCGCPTCQTCNEGTGACDPLCAATQTCCAGACFEGAGRTCCSSNDPCALCETCQISGGMTVGVCGPACGGDTPVCCSDASGWSCVPAGATCCDSDIDCAAIPTFCEVSSGRLLWRYHLCSGSFCTLTAHVCNLASHVCERDICGATTDCGVEPIPPGGTATDGVSICCDSDDDCDVLGSFCDDDLWRYYLCGSVTCTATAQQCSPGQCNDLLGCQVVGPP